MNSLMELISNPVVWKVLISYYVFSALVGALPLPDQTSGKVYQFIFRFMHILAGNISRAAVKFQVPGAETQQAQIRPMDGGSGGSGGGTTYP